MRLCMLVASMIVSASAAMPTCIAVSWPDTGFPRNGRNGNAMRSEGELASGDCAFEAISTSNIFKLFPKAPKARTRPTNVGQVTMFSKPFDRRYTSCLKHFVTNGGGRNIEYYRIHPRLHSYYWCLAHVHMLNLRWQKQDIQDIKSPPELLARVDQKNSSSLAAKALHRRMVQKCWRSMVSGAETFGRPAHAPTVDLLYGLPLSQKIHGLPERSNCLPMFTNVYYSDLLVIY